MKQYIVALSIIFALCQISCSDSSKADASIWLDPWVSCTPTANPITKYGNSHWIHYDFGSVRTLSKSWIWNTNDPQKLNQGFKKVSIDYSEDGETWTHYGEMNFPKAEGKAVYGGFAGPDLVGVKARYMLLTALSNHGDPACSGITEVKFNLLPIEPAKENEGPKRYPEL
ncbi:MAG: discoidin domain-containing protein [Bacteroidota bacterium]